MSGPIVVPYDGSEFSRRAFPLAIDLARRAQAELHVVRVHLFSVPSLEPEIEPPYEPDFLSELIEYEQTDLEKVRQELEQHGITVKTELLTAGLVVPLLREYIEKHSARMVVLTTHGRGGMNRVWLGSTATGLVRTSAAPLILLPIGEADEHTEVGGPIEHVLVTLDGSRRSEQILPGALDLARITGARLTLLRIVPAVHVSEGFHPLANVTGSTARTAAACAAAEAYLGRLAGELRAQGHSAAVEIREEWQSTAQAILTAREELGADTIAMGTHGRGFWSRMLIGSVTDKVIRSARVRILVWNPPEEPGQQTN